VTTDTIYRYKIAIRIQIVRVSPRLLVLAPKMLHMIDLPIRVILTTKFCRNMLEVYQKINFKEL